LADREFEGTLSRLRSGAVVRSWGVPPFRIYYQRQPDELLIVRVHHQARKPMVR
jgi:plasmid stabilization system protein ParE